MSVGERITELRKAAGMSQYALSHAMEVSRQAVSNWENDQGSPDVMHLIHLAEGGLCQMCKTCHWPNCTFGRY